MGNFWSDCLGFSKRCGYQIYELQFRPTKADLSKIAWRAFWWILFSNPPQAQISSERNSGCLFVHLDIWPSLPCINNSIQFNRHICGLVLEHLLHYTSRYTVSPRSELPPRQIFEAWLAGVLLQHILGSVDCDFRRLDLYAPKPPCFRWIHELHASHTCWNFCYHQLDLDCFW